jgi:methylglyoxal reductase
MQYRTLGNSGIEASVIAVGTWAIGGWMWGGTDESDSIKAIQASLDHGINFIDTAPAYGLGLSEKIVAKAIAGRRDKVVLATKCGLVWNTTKGKPFLQTDGHKIYRYLGRGSVRHEVEESLKRLQTHYIDLYQTHWQDPTTPIEDTMQTLLNLKREGKIRAIGVCNIESLDNLERYRRIGPLDSDQEEYNMVDRKPEEELLPYCRNNDVAVLAYSSMARGLLTGKIGPEREFSDGDHRNGRARFSKENRRKVQEMLKELQPIAEKHECTLAQLSVAWVIRQPGLTHALVGARNAKQAEENARAGDVALQKEDLSNINGVLNKWAGWIE